MRVVKKETLKLIANWVERSNDPQVQKIQIYGILEFHNFALLYDLQKFLSSQMVLDNFIPPMLEAVLADYQRCSVPR